MKVGFDAKRAFYNHSGLGNYSRGVISALHSYNPEIQKHLFSPNNGENSYSEVASKGESHFFEGTFKNASRLFKSSIKAQELGLDLFHGLSNEIPTGLVKRNIKSLVTIHDIIFLKFPHYYNRIDRKIYLEKTKFAVKNSDLIITTSNQTKSDLEQYFGVGHKCETIYQHVSQFNNTVPTPNPEKNSYLLYISSFEERKNHLNLLKAFNQIKSSITENLVLIGRQKSTYNQVKEFISRNQLQDRVKLICDADSIVLKQYLQHAAAFVYPSFYEGFGIPLIEAMQHHMPIACSNIAVFRELASNFAHYFDPQSVESISNTITSLLDTDKPINNDSKLEKHLDFFSAKNHAKQINRCYQTLI